MVAMVVCHTRDGYMVYSGRCRISGRGVSLYNCTQSVHENFRTHAYFGLNHAHS